jgi:hypothetical protein
MLETFAAELTDRPPVLHMWINITTPDLKAAWQQGRKEPFHE